MRDSRVHEGRMSREGRRLRTIAGVLGLVLSCVALGTEVSAAPAPGKTDAPAREVAQVDLNKADAEQLASVPGIGKVTAERILEFRQQNGPFRSVDDLMKVKGIGEKSLEKIRPYVKVARSA